MNDSGPSDFAVAVLVIVDSTEPGQILTYGEVAAEAGNPGAARAVGGVLRRHGAGHPWWRIVAANGRLVPGGEQLHQEKLRAEGVEVSDGRVVMRNL